MRRGLTLLLGMTVLAAVFMTYVDSAMAADLDPWNVSSISKLTRARGASTASATEPLKYLHLELRFDASTTERKFHDFRVVDAAGKEVGKRWGHSEPRSLLIFEREQPWDSLVGLYLDGMDHREPLFALRPVVDTPVAVRPVATDAVTRPLAAVPDHRIATVPRTVDLAPVRRLDDIVFEGTRAYVGRRDVLVDRGGTRVIGGGTRYIGDRHVIQGGGDRLALRDGVSVGRGGGSGVGRGGSGGSGAGLGSGSGDACEDGDCPDGEGEDQLADRGKGEGAGPGEGEGKGEGAGPGEGEGKGEGASPGEGKGEGDCPGEGEGKGEGDCPGEGEGKGEGASPGEGEGAGEGDCPGEGEGKGEGASPGEGAGAGEGDCPGEGEGKGEGDCPGEGAGEGDCPGEGKSPGEMAQGEGKGPCPCGKSGCKGDGGPGCGCGPGGGPGGGDCEDGPGRYNPFGADPFRDRASYPEMPRMPEMPHMPGYLGGRDYPGGYGQGEEGRYGELARAGMPLPPPPTMEDEPAMVLYISCGSDIGPGTVYQVDEHGRILGKVTLPHAATGLALHGDHGLVCALPRDGGKIMYIDDSGRSSTLMENDESVIHPVDVGVGADSDAVVVADNLGDSLSAMSAFGDTPKTYMKLDGQEWERQSVSVAVTRDGHVLMGSDGNEGIYRLSGHESSLDKPMLPGRGSVASDIGSLKWAATQSPNQVYVFEGEESIRKLRLPPNKSHYQNGKLSFAPAGCVVVAARDSDKVEDAPWLLMYETAEGKEGHRKLFKWEYDRMIDFVVGPRMLWERNDRDAPKMLH